MYKHLIEAIAPTGKLRASINLGNPILANRDSKTGEPFGLSIDLAHEFSKRIGVNLDLVVVDSASKSVDAVVRGDADFGFFAIDPIRGADIAFTAPYVLIEGAYLVHDDSPLIRNEEVDVAGHRIVVGKGSAYDLYLTREILQAEIVRAPTSPMVVDEFIKGAYEVAAGVHQQLEADAKRIPDLRVLPGRFMVIQQAMGMSKSKGDEVVEIVAQFVEEMKISNFVQQALNKHGIQGASVAPLK